MKKSFGLAKVFLIGILAVGLFGLLSFAFAWGHNTPNPGHPGSEICDDNFCVVGASASTFENSKVGIGTAFPSSPLSIAISYYTNSNDFLRLIGPGSQSSLVFTKESVGPTDGSWVIRTNKNSGLPLKIGTTYQGAQHKLDLDVSGNITSITGGIYAHNKPLINDIRVGIYGSAQSSGGMSNRWYRLPGDLNTGAGGNFIYLEVQYAE